MILRGVSHLHTSYSYDGKLSIRDFKEFLLEQGVDFALITEHSDYIEPTQAEKFIKDCHNLSDNRITLIPGFEVPYKDAHILMIGVDHFVKNGTNNAEELKQWKEHAQFAVWAHPHKNKYLLYDAIKDVIDGVEVWNSQYDGTLAPRMKVLGSLAELRARGHKTFSFAGLDFHREEHAEGPSIMVESDNTEQAIIEALREGTYVLKSSTTTISATGDIIKGFPRLLILQSFWSISVISTSKKISAIAAKIRLPIPQKFRKAVRSKL